MTFCTNPKHRLDEQLFANFVLSFWMNLALSGSYMAFLRVSVKVYQST